MKIVIKKNKIVYSVMAFYFYSGFIVYVFQCITGLEANNNIVNIFKMCVYLLPNIYMLYHMLYNKKLKFLFVFVFAYSVILLISCYILPQIVPICISNTITIITRCLFAAYFGYEFQNSKELIRSFRPGYFLIFLFSLLILIGFIKIDTIGAEYMQIGIIMNIPIAIMFFDGYLNQRYKYIFFSVISAFCMLIFSSRGTAFSLVFMIVTGVVCDLYVKKKRIYFIIAGMLINFAVLFLALSNVGSKIFPYVLNEFFPDSRNASLYAVNMLTNDSGRGVLQKILLKEIRSNPLKVRGIYSDRVILSNYLYHGSFVSEGAYAHNIVIEVLYQFGVLVGAVILILLCVIAVKAIKNILKNKKQEDICVMGLCLGACIWLLISNSYILNAPFWFSMFFFLKKKNQ